MRATAAVPALALSACGRSHVPEDEHDAAIAHDAGPPGAGCDVEPPGPVRGFGKVWCENDAVRAGVGAALAPELGGPGFAPCTSQQFQGGLAVHDPNADHRACWVLFDDRSWRRFAESRRETPPYDSAAPSRSDLAKREVPCCAPGIGALAGRRSTRSWAS